MALLSTKTNSVSIVLRDDKDWDDWIEVIQFIAIVSKIWAYIDPTNINPLLLEKPLIPIPQSVNPGATYYTSLINNEKEQIKFVQILYIELNKSFEK